MARAERIRGGLALASVGALFACGAQPQAPEHPRPSAPAGKCAQVAIFGHNNTRYDCTKAGTAVYIEPNLPRGGYFRISFSSLDGKTPNVKKYEGKNWGEDVILDAGTKCKITANVPQHTNDITVFEACNK
ncbi:hypothetical protein HZA75_03100 [Candidatus Roizmanbacteria bacterium]|nr:hypothetical protein [Candidatus Roizmanbacteria bacterium]